MTMLWQFKSHHNHLNSDYQLQTNMIDRDFAKDYNFVVEEGESIKALERMVSDIVSKVPLSQKSRCRLAQLYYDLAKRMLLMGSMTMALEYVRQGHKYRKSLLYECTGHMNPLVAARVWSIRFEEFILAPNYNFICFLSSIYQKATILELIGSGHEVLQKLIWGKTFSLHRCLSFYVAHFQALIRRIYRKIQDFDQGKKGLVEAQEHYNHVSCEKCKLILEHDIRKECVKQTRTNGLPIAEAMELTSRKKIIWILNHMRAQNHMRTNGLPNSMPFQFISKEKVYANEKMEACEVFLENISMVAYTEDKDKSDSDADKILHRLTPRPGVDDLSDFVKEFYNELEPHTIVVMNVLGPKYKKFMPMFLPFLETSECVTCLMISSHMESWLGPKKNILLGEILEGQKNQKLDNFGRFTGEGVNDSKTAPMLPWESMKILENQEIYRMPSVSNPEIENIDEWKLAVSLNNEFHLEGIFWKDVAVEEILEILKSSSLQYISRNALKTLEVCALAILMGCASGLLKSEGPYTPLGAPIDYLLAGSPIVMCNLWNIHQHWALELTETLL
ncbi:separase isoform X1 [Tanacetum coccineum]|uniref:Separase isoform X1 n=1 Tax=Tanacetum coccineum TaxID=301880 RepID=A0ABQ5J0L7_9ASTR